ncbi:hypothetical protein KCU72_g7, partial [Aureobasidium melanogenum]
MAAEIDTKVCHCGRLAANENARMLRNWADERTGYLVHKFGMSETMPTFANVTAIQMQRDLELGGKMPWPDTLMTIQLVCTVKVGM